MGVGGVCLVTDGRDWVKERDTFLDDDDGDDHTINTEDTSHDDWDDGLHDKFGFEDTHGADSDTGFGGTVGGSKVGKDEGWGDSNVSEEVVVRVLDSAHCVLLFDWNIRIGNYKLVIIVGW